MTKPKKVRGWARFVVNICGEGYLFIKDEKRKIKLGKFDGYRPATLIWEKEQEDEIFD